MNEQLQQKLDLMVENSEVVRHSARMDFTIAAHLGALIFTSKNAHADESVIRANRALLKSRVGVFSNARDAATNLAVLAEMSLADDPSAYLDTMLDAYSKLTESKVFRSPELIFTAINIAQREKPADFENVAQRSWATLAKMNSLHPVITTQSDLTLAYMLSTSNIDSTALLAEAEDCYKRLKSKGFLFNKDALQSISIILALSDRPTKEKCDRFNTLRGALKSSGHRIGRMELGILAAFVDVDIPIEQIVQEVGEADDYLKAHRGFGAISCGAQLRRVFASTLVLQSHLEEETGVSAASSSVAANIAAEIVFIIIMTIIMTELATSQMRASSN